MTLMISPRPPKAPIGTRHRSLGQAEQVGRDAEVLVRPAIRDHDAGLDLVEDEHRAVGRGEVADALAGNRAVAERRRC